MNENETPSVEHDDFVEEAVELDEQARDLLSQLAEALDEESPADGLKARLFSSGIGGARFGRFGPKVAELLDVDLAEANRLLDDLDVAGSWAPGLIEGMEQYDVDGGPAVAGAITGFLRLSPGLEFPEHKHLGDELVLVVQGYFVDHVTRESFGPGAVIPMPAGSTHSFGVIDGGTDLLLLTVIQVGVEIGGRTLGPETAGL
jgi:hypothetical protein